MANDRTNGILHFDLTNAYTGTFLNRVMLNYPSKCPRYAWPRRGRRALPREPGGRYYADPAGVD